MFRPFVLFLYCFLASASSALLGAKECTYGPSFWCASLKNAKTCGAVRHCIDASWEKQVLPKDDGSICKLCKDMVNEARQQLESPENQALLKQVFEQTCRYIPIKEIQKECITYADEYIPELIETLASQMNPQVVCATVGLCNSVMVDRLMHKYEGVMKHELKPVAAPAKICTDCEAFLQDIRKVALSYPQEELLNYMLQVCGRLDSLADGCKMIVEVNFPAIYDYIEHQFNAKEACELVGFCGKIYGDTVTKISHRTGDEICDFCETMVQHYKDTLASNTSKAEFKEILDGICHSTGHFSQECLALVDHYYEMIYDILISEVDAQKICKAIGLCGPNSVFKNDFSTWTLFNIRPEDHLPLIPLGSKSESHSIDNFNIMIPRTIAENDHNIEIISLADTGLRSPKVGKKNNNLCMLCEFVLHFLQDFLQEKHTREEIASALDNVCRLMPKSVAEQCQDYVDAYSDQLIQFIIYEMDPSTVCPMMHLCPGETTLLAMKENNLCVTCEFVVQIVDELLNSNVMKIEDALKVVCDVFPSSVQSTCKIFVQEYGKNIIEFLEKEASPKKICTLIMLCKPLTVYTGPNYATELLMEIGQPVKFTGPNYATQILVNMDKPIVEKTDVGFTQSIGCVLCEFVMHELDHFLLFPSTKEKIESAVERVCFVLPSNLKADCLSFMDKYGVKLIELLVTEIDPDMVCRKASICGSSLTKDMPIADVLVTSDICDVCQQTVNAASKLETVTADNVIMGTCAMIGDKVKRNMCEKFVREAAQFMKPLLKELGDPKTVCMAMGKCSNEAKRELLGKKKCTWGPSYWCISEWHAASCKATKHCEEKVWNSESRIL